MNFALYFELPTYMQLEFAPLSLESVILVIVGAVG
ncbi:hypothetical protein AABM17_1663 [Neisseria musculi]|uniref:Uncharacterized protein n=1 Tax=Neisseria musculi TaxID=1815583 RepID=A0A7H1MEI8_9NEIS|nr:hypothetical protein H7A79_1663 [Neisseria musculi]